MAITTTDTTHHTGTSELEALSASWRRHLTAQRTSPATLSTYGTSVRLLDRFLAERGMPTSVAAITREHVEAFIAHLLERWKPATAHNRYQALRSFFGWLVEEGEIRESPMARMKPPRLPGHSPFRPDRGPVASAARCLRGGQAIRRASRCSDPARLRGFGHPPR